MKLRRAEGVEEPSSAPRSTTPIHRQSLMPEGLEQNINLQDMADLIAFLRRGG